MNTQNINLIFSQIDSRRQCESEVVIEGTKVQCGFSASKTVTIPQGLHYFDGKLSMSESMLSSTIPICQNHEMRLKNAHKELVSQIK